MGRTRSEAYEKAKIQVFGSGVVQQAGDWVALYPDTSGPLGEVK